MKPVFLIGYMASGKTTFGKALSMKTGLRFIDLDDYIEQAAGSTIKEIFEEQGEEGFRRIEKRVLHEVAQLSDTIIACGGGTPCFFDNMEMMKAMGATVFLKASTAVLINRLESENARRPLMAGKNRTEIEDTINRQLRDRVRYYSQAQIIWNSDRLESEEEIEASVSDFIKNNSFVFSDSFI